MWEGGRVVLSLPPPGSWYKGRPHYWGGSLTPGFKTALSSLCQRLRLDLNAGPRFRSRDNACSNVSASLEWKRNTRRRDSRVARRQYAYALRIKQIRANERYERKQYHLHKVHCIYEIPNFSIRKNTNFNSKLVNLNKRQQNKTAFHKTKQMFSLAWCKRGHCYRIKMFVTCVVSRLNSFSFWVKFVKIT